jgi:hypothetical protein
MRSLARSRLLSQVHPEANSSFFLRPRRNLASACKGFLTAEVAENFRRER